MFTTELCMLMIWSLKHSRNQHFSFDFLMSFTYCILHFFPLIDLQYITISFLNIKKIDQPTRNTTYLLRDLETIQTRPTDDRSNYETAHIRIRGIKTVPQCVPRNVRTIHHVIVQSLLRDNEASIKSIPTGMTLAFSFGGNVHRDDSFRNR